MRNCFRNCIVEYQWANPFKKKLEGYDTNVGTIRLITYGSRSFRSSYNNFILVIIIIFFEIYFMKWVREHSQS